MWSEGMYSRTNERDEGNMTLKKNGSPVKRQRWMRRRSRPLLQTRDENTATIESTDKAGVLGTQWMRSRGPLMPIRDENSADEAGILGTQSAKKQHVPKSNTSYSKAHLRRSCVPAFTNTESVYPSTARATTGATYKDEQDAVPWSTERQSSGHRGQDDESAPAGPLGSHFISRFGKRRRSRLLVQDSRCNADLEAKPKDDTQEECPGSVNRNVDQYERVCEEKRTDISLHQTRPRMKMEVQDEPASENKSCPPTAEGRGQFNVTRRRSVLEIVRQRAQSSVPSVEKPAASVQRRSMVFAGLGPRSSVRRPRFHRRPSHSSSERIIPPKDPVVADNAEGEKLQECRRLLEFESGDEAEEPEDHTVPLTMMAQTPIIMRASVLQNPVNQKLQKEVCEPVIKKSLFDDCIKKPSRFRRRPSSRISQLSEDSATNEGRQPSLLSEKKSSFPAPPGSTKRIQRRRSAAVLCVRTPMRKTTTSEARSISKFIGSSISSKIPFPKGSQKQIRMRRSLGVSRSSQTQTDHTTHEENINDMTLQKCNKVDAATNTTINFAQFKHIDFKILEEIENFCKEQEELSTKAVLLQEQTSARSLEMKARVMESFMTSISPLRRLKTLFSKTENPVDGNEAQESPQCCNAEDEVGVCDGGGATQGIRASSSLVDWESPKAPLNLRDHQIQWKRRRQDSRLIRAYQEPSIEEEEFSCTHPENTSPFTKLVGDCERPSLAPMTPHSRHNVSEIKMSLREQMEKLYRN